MHPVASTAKVECNAAHTWTQGSSKNGFLYPCGHPLPRRISGSEAMHEMATSSSPASTSGVSSSLSSSSPNQAAESTSHEPSIVDSVKPQEPRAVTSVDSWNLEFSQDATKTRSVSLVNDMALAENDDLSQRMPCILRFFRLIFQFHIAASTMAAFMSPTSVTAESILRLVTITLPEVQWQHIEDKCDSLCCH